MVELTAHARLPESVSLEYGALVEPLSVAFHARDRANLKPGSTVLILGAGAVGLLCAAAAKVSGAKAVVIADIQEDRVNFAVQNGFADASIVVPMARPQTIEDKLAYAKELAEKVTSTQIKGEAIGEVTVTFECTGVESCMQTAIYVSCDTACSPPTQLLTGTFLVDASRRKSHDHWHGQSNPDSSHLGSGASRSGPRWCVQICKQLPRRDQYAG